MPEAQMIQHPQSYVDIVGQQEAVSRLKAFSDFHLKNASSAGHVLIVGDEGMGKSTIAKVLARELGLVPEEIDAAKLQIRGDLSAILTNLRNNQALILPQIRLKRTILDTLAPVLRTQNLQITLGVGAAARTHVMKVNPFTLIATVTKRSDCAAELQSCFSLTVQLQPYSIDDLAQIAKRIAADANVEIDSKSSRLLAMNSARSPHQLELLMQRVARAMKTGQIAVDDTVQALSAFGINVRTSDDGAEGSRLTNMSGIEFEKLIATLLTRMEFRTEITRATGDGGVDIVAVLDRPIVGGKYLFQCKRYDPDTLIGASVVRDFYGAVTADRAIKGILITTSDFTPQAREFAERVGLELVNQGQLQQLLGKYGMLGADD